MITVIFLFFFFQAEDGIRDDLVSSDVCSSDLEGYTLYTSAAIQVFAAAADKAKSVELDKLVAALHGQAFDTVVGKLQFDAKGDVLDPKYVVYIWKDGKYGELQQ